MGKKFEQLLEGNVYGPQTENRLNLICNSENTNQSHNAIPKPIRLPSPQEAEAGLCI